MRSRHAIRVVAALSAGVLLAAHVGSPDVYFSGRAGPYAVDVAVRPPQVVPGIAQVLVHVTDATVTRVVIRPVFWRAGSKGAPMGDDARPVEGSSGSYAGQLWLMARGSYSVQVTVSGAAGSGTVVVPVGAVATGQLSLGTGMRWLLAVLGLLLASGFITAVRAAVGESQVPPGETIAATRRRRANVATLIMVPVVAFLVFGGARWWTAEARAYRRTLYRPLSTRATIRDSAGHRILSLAILDSSWGYGQNTPVMLDHGKLAHLFIVRRDSLDVFAHLHPGMSDPATFESALPPLPSGRYRIYQDIVHESGFERTLVDSLTVSAPPVATAAWELSADDSWYAGDAVRVSASDTAANAGDGIHVRWSASARPIAGRVGALRFALDRAGGPVAIEPYLGMNGHAVVMRRDGKVFIHLHPNGTASMASQLAFALRDRGDTTATGRLRLADSAMSMARVDSLRELAFPYAFPSGGEYRVWIQFRTLGRVRTVAFDASVSGSQPE